MAKNDAKQPSNQVNQKGDMVPMHKRIAMGESLDGKALGTKEVKKPSSSNKNK